MNLAVLRLAIAEHLEEIATLFKNPKITLIVRAPDLKDGDLVLTEDNLDDAIAALQKLKAAGLKEST